MKACDKHGYDKMETLLVADYPLVNHGKTLGKPEKWWSHPVQLGLHGILLRFTLWQTNKTMEHHHFSWENSRFRLGNDFNSYVSHCRRVYEVTLWSGVSESMNGESGPLPRRGVAGCGSDDLLKHLPNLAETFAILQKCLNHATISLCLYRTPSRP